MAHRRPPRYADAARSRSCSRHQAAAWPRLSTPSLSRMLATWRLTVCGLRSKARAISLLLSPAAMLSSTASSRALRAGDRRDPPRTAAASLPLSTSIRVRRPRPHGPGDASRDGQRRRGGLSRACRRMMARPPVRRCDRRLQGKAAPTVAGATFILPRPGARSAPPAGARPRADPTSRPPAPAARPRRRRPAAPRPTGSS